MAEKIITDQGKVSMSVDARDAHDELTKKLLQLQALLAATCGDAQRAFDGLSDELKGNYMWACVDMVGDCLTLSGKFTATQLN